MASAVAIVGKSGSGKTTSLFPNEKINHIGLDPNRTMIVNVSGKDLPVKGGRTLYPTEGKGIRQFTNYSAKQVCDLIEKCDTIWKDHIDNIVIDDAQYLQAFEFMGRATERGFDKFLDIGLIGFSPVRKAMKAKNPKLKVFFLYHSDTDNKGFESIKTSGKLIDQHITMEGLFTTVLFTKMQIDLQSGKTEYYFMTNSDTTNTAKSPIDMFESTLIPNDLGLVAKKIDEYL